MYLTRIKYISVRHLLTCLLSVDRHTALNYITLHITYLAPKKAQKPKSLKAGNYVCYY